MKLLKPENYNVALKVFDNICAEWELTSLEKDNLGVTNIPKPSSLVVMSRVFSIYRSLHTIFCDYHQANCWIRKENIDLGSAAIELMGTNSGLEVVQNYLSDQVGLVFDYGAA